MSVQIDEPSYTVTAVAAYELQLAGHANTAAALYHLNPWVRLGVRGLSGRTFGDEAWAALAVAAWHPMAGSFYLETGLGLSRYTDFNAKDSELDDEDHDFDDLYRGARTDLDGDGVADDTRDTTLGFEVRFGNRWTTPIGLTLGLTYAGFSSVGLLVVGAEVGWSL